MALVSGSRTRAKNIEKDSSKATVFAVGGARQRSLKTLKGGEAGTRRGLRSSEKKIGAHAGIKSSNTISTLNIQNCLPLAFAARVYLGASS